MATFGKTGVGGTPQGVDANFKFGSKFTLPVAAFVTKLSAYLDGNGGGAGTQVLKGVIYSVSAGVPNARLGITVEVTVTASQSPGWVDFAFSSPVSLASGDYFLCLHAGTTTLVARNYYDTVASAEEWNADTYSDGPADPWGTNNANENKERSIYATYDATAPVLVSAVVNGASLVLTYDEPLNVGSTPANGDFDVEVNTVDNAVTGRVVSGNTVTLTLTTPVVLGQTVILDYTAGGNPIEDVVGNNAANLVNQAVTNVTGGISAGNYSPLPPKFFTEIDFIHDPLAVPFERLMRGANARFWLRLKEATDPWQDETINNQDGVLANLGGGSVVYQQPGPINEAGTYSLKINTGGKWISLTGGALTPPGAWTWGLWFKRDGNAVGLIMDSYDGGAGSTTPVVNLIADGSLIVSDPGGSSLATPAGTIKPDTWHHIAVVFDAAAGQNSGKWTIYVDGIAKAADVSNHTVNTSGMNTIYFGSDHSGGVTAASGWYAEPFMLHYAAGALIGKLYGSAGANNYPTPTYEDVRDFTRKITIARGRQRELDRVEAGTMSYTLDDPDRRFEPEFADGEYYPDVLPSRQARTRIEDLSTFKYSPTVLTASGNEIVDSVRLAALGGDGLALEQSIGMWEATTNLDTRGGFETDTTGWTSVNCSTFATTNTSPPPSDHPLAVAKFGARAARVITNAANGYVHRDVTGLTAATQYTRSVWIYRTETAATISVAARNAADSADLASVNAPAVLGWSRVIVTFTTAAGQTTVKTRITATTSGTQFFVDGAQMEQQPIATPYVETNGATATRNAARVQVPVAYLDETQGWAAFKVRVGWANATEPYGGAGAPTVLDWRDSAGARITLDYDESANGWRLMRTNGAGTAHAFADAVAKGDLVTVIAAWTATHVRLSVDGAAFTETATASIPALAAALADIGSQAGASHLDGDIMWAAFGTGVITNAMAAALHALTRDPTPNDLASTTAGLKAILPGDNATDAHVVNDDDVELGIAYAERWPPDWLSFRRTRVVVPFSDLMASLANWTITGSYPAETTGARVNRVLDAVGWPSTMRQIDAGIHTVIAAVPVNEGALAHLELMAESEGGLLFIDGSGRVVFHNRDHRQTAYRSRVSQYTFGDSPAEIPYKDAPMGDFDRQRVINKVVVSWGNPSATVEKVDWPSVNQHGELARPITTALSTAAQATLLAERLLARNKDPKLRFLSMVVDAKRDSRLSAAMASLGIGDRVTVIRRPVVPLGAPAGTPLQRDVWIERVDHAIDIEKKFTWTATYILSAVES